MAPKHKLAATAAADPPDEPPGTSFLFSEETGLISLARRGRLERVAGEAALRDKLNEQLSKSTQPIVGSAENFISTSTQD